MEKFKIYVHHNYTYELFWYFFHGVDVNINDIVTHTNTDTAFNKKVPITEHIKINAEYKQNTLEILFCGDDCWDSDGEHILDYSIYVLQKELVSDRGYNTTINKIIDNELIPFFNKIVTNTKRIHFFHLDWEGHNPYYHHNMNTIMDRRINIYLDEMESDIETVRYSNKHFLFTNNFISFIYPNTLGLREYKFFGDILKYKNDYKYKLNFPIRRIYGHKLRVYNKINSIKNCKINVTNSSFHDSQQYSMDMVGELRNPILKKLGNDNLIQKRGYGIYDWGGEWNENNVKEMMWKLFGLSEVNIIPEYHPDEAYKNVKKKENPLLISNSFITEKSVSHILAKKPFIPVYYKTIQFYDSILIKYGYDTIRYPIEYYFINDVIDEINEIASNDKWEFFRNELQRWVDNTHECIIDILNNNNDYLNKLINLPNLFELNKIKSSNIL